MYKLLTAKDLRFTPLVQTNVPELTLETINRELKLDTWECQKFPNHKPDTNRVEQSYFLQRVNNDPDQIEGRNKILCPYVGERYEVIQYTEGLKWLDYFVSEDLLKVDSALYINDQEFAVTCEIGLEANVQDGDTVRRYLLLALSHSRSPRLLGFTDIRPVCENTLAMAKTQSMRDTAKNFRLETSGALQEAKNCIDLISQRFEKDVIRYQDYRSIKLDAFQRESITRQLLNMPLSGFEGVSDKGMERYQMFQDSYQNSPGMEVFDSNEHTGWRMLNAVTWFAKGKGRNELSQYKNEMFGAGRRMRNQVIETLNMMLV